MPDRNLSFLASGSGLISYSSGMSILYSYPGASGAHIAYPGQSTELRISGPFMRAIENSGLNFIDDRPAPAQIPSTSRYFSTNLPAQLGNSATLDAAQRVTGKYGWRASGLQMELNGIQGYPRTSHTLLNGQTFHPDLKYRTTSLWNGTTLHLDEVKAWQYLSANRDNLAQLRNYSQAISEINSNYAAQRAVGAALRNVGVGLGVAGATLDAYATYGQISQDLSIGDTVGAGRAGTAFVGRQGGGFLGAIGGTLGGALVGTSIFGEAGAAAGSIAPGIGNVAFGIAGGHRGSYGR